MPVVITFDLEAAEQNEHAWVQSMFERLGWQNLGGSSYRYPRLGAELDQPVEDWFNHVIPALMLFRAFLRTTGRELKKFTLDTQSSTGYNRVDVRRNIQAFGHPPLPSAEIRFYDPGNPQFAQNRLETWIDAIPFPYPLPVDEREPVA